MVIFLVSCIPPFLPVATPIFAAILNAPLNICALPAKMAPHINPSASPLPKPNTAPSQPPVIPPTTAPMPALTAILIPTAFAEAINALPAANNPAVPIPAVKNVTTAPPIIKAVPMTSFTQLFANQLPTLFQKLSQLCPVGSQRLTGLFPQ